MSAVDFEREGLLDGLDSEQERAARVELLQQLIAEGVPLEDLREATFEDRLALLPVELVFTRDCQYSIGEVAEKAAGSGRRARRSRSVACSVPSSSRRGASSVLRRVSESPRVCEATTQFRGPWYLNVPLLRGR